MALWPLDALDHWQKTLPSSTVDSIMEEVLPFLEPYLGSAERLKKETPYIGSLRSQRSFTPKVFPYKGPHLECLYERSLQDEDKWRDVQRRVVTLLGRVGPSCARLLDRTEDEVVVRAAAGWKTDQYLKFSLPLNDMKPEIHLGAFLPRIIHLAQHSSKFPHPWASRD